MRAQARRPLPAGPLHPEFEPVEAALPDFMVVCEREESQREPVLGEYGSGVRINYAGFEQAHAAWVATTEHFEAGGWTRVAQMTETKGIMSATFEKDELWLEAMMVTLDERDPVRNVFIPSIVAGGLKLRVLVED